MDSDFRHTPVKEIADAVRAKEVSAREVTAMALGRIEALNPVLNAFVALDAERALEQAAAIDQIVGSGGDPGALAGVPIGVKDLEDAAGYRTTHGSAVFAHDPIAQHDSVLVARLRAAGCVVVGKTNTSDFGWCAATDNVLFGATKNPWNIEHSVGGSSGGSAAAIAAGMVPLATGSDGGGSIRIPSACCGLSGIKTSMGRVPTGGPEPPGWPGLSTKGPMARRFEDVVQALDVVVAPEPTDLRSLPRPEASWLAALDDPHPPTRVLWSPTLGYADVDAEVRSVCERALSMLESIGTEVIEVDLVFDEDPVDAWSTLTNVFLLRSLDPRSTRAEWDDLHPTLAAMLERARKITGRQVVEAMDACHRLNLRLVKLFSEARILITPTCAGLAPPLSLGISGLVNGVVTDRWIRFTYPFNMTGSPAATLNAGFGPSGLPVGLLLVGPAHADLVVLRTAAALEAALGLERLAPMG